MKPTAHRADVMHSPDASRVITQFFQLSPQRSRSIIERVLKLNDEEVQENLAQLRHDFSDRHRDIDGVFKRHFDQVQQWAPENTTLSAEQQALIGAYFTKEYSIEAAALFNPSIVLHPDQSNLPEDSCRFVMSLRATGEGHISSIEFRTGTVNGEGHVALDPPAKNAEDALSARNINTASTPDGSDYLSPDYTLEFSPELALSERVIFPRAESERMGIEDARFVQFIDDDGQSHYHATYTAYDGNSITPKILSTDDFEHFTVQALSGAAAQNKGMALFPRKINGQYAMLGRQDGESSTIMFSDDLLVWEESTILREPKHSWETIQVGNCGSPIETEAGWLVLTHGVGPARQYSIGALLLDLDDPQKIIGDLDLPILTPEAHERDGYVPNVVYSCGAIQHGENLILPYAASDQLFSVATFPMKELLTALAASPPQPERSTAVERLEQQRQQAATHRQF